MMTITPQTRHVHVVTQFAPGQFAVADAQFIPVESLFMAGDEPLAVAQRQRAARFREAHREQERERVRAYRMQKAAHTASPPASGANGPERGMTVRTA